MTTTPDTPATGYLPATLNPFEPGFFDDPYAQYRAVREQDPVHESPIGAWLLMRYDDVSRVLRDPSLSVEERKANMVRPASPEIEAMIASRPEERGNHSMLNLDPPDHHRLRRLVAKVFTPRTVEGLRPRVEELVRDHLDAAAARGTGEMDVIADLAFPLPFVVISEMLGIPEGHDRLQLREWSGAIVKTFDPILTPDEARTAFAASDNMWAYLDDVIAWKRDHPADDVLSAMIAAEDEGDRLSTAELNEQTALLFIAGHETTVNLIGNGTLALLRNRDQLEVLQRDPSLDANAIEELLRYDSPVQMSRRVSTRTLEIDGKVIEPGLFVMTCLGAANHDPSHFGADADRLDVRRPNANEHVSFGGGFHMCLGAHLARLEGQVAIGTLVRRYPGLTLATDEAEWNGRMVLRGLTRLPVAFGSSDN
ncbi:MAG: cytochrome [Actinomycetia bacterium]|nr:cytochrome [Actinomycetes bacterium]